ncbi:MAG TPA: hypothetical protein VGE31_03290 [Candidatus Paceibacterota bacterium]
MKHILIIGPVILVIIALLVLIGISEMKENPQPENETPAQELPSVTATNTTNSAPQSATFKYPEELPTTYITGMDWPPEIFLNTEGYGCTPAGAVTDRAGKTEEKTINGRSYCVTTLEEGAAGSVYRQYAYMTEKEGTSFVLTLSTRSVQCGNFDAAERVACEEEQRTFDLDNLVDQMAETVEFNTESE